MMITDLICNRTLILSIFILLTYGCTRENTNPPSSSHLVQATVTAAQIGQDQPDISNKHIGTKITFIHSGDFHGDLLPHSIGRSDSPRQEGGLARVATVIKQIRMKHLNAIHVHTGDTIAGSAEATFSRGEALIRVVDQMGVDVFVPGNWEFSFGIYRYLQFFGTTDQIETYTAADESKMAIVIPASEQGIIGSYGLPFKTEQRWGAIAANAYFNGKPVDPGVNNKGVGELLTTPYRIMTIDNVKIGFIGCTTNRGPQVVSSNITTGISFTNCKGEVKFPQNKAITWPVEGHVNQGQEDPTLDGIPGAEGGDDGYRAVSEIERWVNHLRNVEDVDIVAVLSEAGIAENIFNAENISGVDIYFSSDMHEQTIVPVVVTAPDGNKVILIEEGEDGAQVGELEILVVDGKIIEWEWVAHIIDENIPEDPKIAELIAEVIKPFYGATFVPGQYFNPYNNAKLMQPLDTVMGSTDMMIERNRFSTEWDPANKIMPAVIEGTGHALMTDAFRILTNADIGGIRGFRYANTVLAGDNITFADMYHYFPIGAMIAKADIPTTPESELAQEALANLEDKDGDGRTIKDNKDNPRHFLGWPRNLIQEIELSGNSTMNPIIYKWGGGWVFNYSGIKFDFQPTGKNFNKYGTVDRARISNVTFNNGTPLSTALGANVSYASYYYDADANRINRNKIAGKNDREIVGDKIQILAKDGIELNANYILVNPTQFKVGTTTSPPAIFPLDAVEALARYIGELAIDVYDWDDATLLKGSKLYTAQGLNGGVKKAEFNYPRINLINDAGITENTLVDANTEFGFPAIEPLRGAEGALLNGNVTLPGGYTKGIADVPKAKY